MVKDRPEVVTDITRQYVRGGLVQFERVLAISAHARIPHLTHVYGYEAIHKIIAAMLKALNDSLNLIRPMTAQQIFDCSEALVMTTEEDQLAMEDYVLFFKGIKEGKYGRILDRVDQQTIFSMLEQYREERHREYMNIKLDRHQAHKATGATERTNQPNPIAESMVKLGDRLNRMKDQLKEQREINRMKEHAKNL